MSNKSVTEQKTVYQHILDIKDDYTRERCLANLDKKCANLLCYSTGYALMLGVEQVDRKYWESVYLMLNKGEDHSRFYSKIAD